MEDASEAEVKGLIISVQTYTHFGENHICWPWAEHNILVCMHQLITVTWARMLMLRKTIMQLYLYNNH